MIFPVWLYHPQKDSFYCPSEAFFNSLPDKNEWSDEQVKKVELKEDCSKCIEYKDETFDALRLLKKALKEIDDLQRHVRTLERWRDAHKVKRKHRRSNTLLTRLKNDAEAALAKKIQEEEISIVEKYNDLNG
jgi:hypothetical protein